MRLPVVFVLAFVTLIAAATSARADEPTTEWVGLEVAPGWFNLTAGVPGNAEVPLYSLGGAATLRVLRQVWGRSSWTPVQLSLGGAGGTWQQEGALVGISTEAGVRRAVRADWTFEAGLALVVGGFWTDYSNNCDGDCAAGGAPVMISPVARLNTARGRVVVGGFARAMVPIPVLTPDPGGAFGWIRHPSVGLLIGLEVAVRSQ